jgi:hypothetical protein
MNNRQRNHRLVFRMSLVLGGLILAFSLTRIATPVMAMTGSDDRRSAALCTGGTPNIWPAGNLGEGVALRHSDVLSSYVYLPLIARGETCQPIPGESYDTLAVPPPPTDRPAEEHADLNLALRGYELTGAYKGLVDYSGAGDPGAPQLIGLFADKRIPTFNSVYQVYHWDWNCNCRGALITNPEVTLARLDVAPDETIHVPDSGYTLGSGYEVLVLYASTRRITLKYTPDDNVVSGYTLHVENVCVEPSLLALYQAWNNAGRGRLPALRPGQAFGRALDNPIGIAIRDNGAFMDPRSRKDWWQGQ